MQLSLRNTDYSQLNCLSQADVIIKRILSFLFLFWPTSQKTRHYMEPKTAPAGNETRKVMAPRTARLVKYFSTWFGVSISAPVKRLKA